MDILKLITSQMGEGAISKLSQLTGESEENTGRAVQVAVPTLLNALNNNSNDANGASGILSALDRDHDGSILDDVMGFLGKTDGSEGNGILKHMLGGKREAVENSLSKSSGVSSASMSKIMAMLAPIIMGYLGKQKKESGIKSSGGISDLLTSVVGSLGNNGTGGLDIGDILGMLGGGGNAGKQSGGGGILGTLGKLFGK
jgi:hypothetical protein